MQAYFDKIVKGLAKKKIITFPDYVIMIQLWKIVFYESNKSEFTEENSNGTVPTDYIYSDFNISNNIICDIHLQENKKALADIVFGRTSSAAYIHRTDDLL